MNAQNIHKSIPKIIIIETKTWMPGTNSYDTTSMNAKNSTRENTKQGKIKVRPLNRFLASFHQFKST